MLVFLMNLVNSIFGLGTAYEYIIAATIVGLVGLTVQAWRAIFKK